MNCVIVNILALAVFLSLTFTVSNARTLTHSKSRNFARIQPRSGRRSHFRFSPKQAWGRRTFRVGRQEQEELSPTNQESAADLADPATESPLQRSYGAVEGAEAEAPQLSYGAPLGDTIDNYEGNLPGVDSVSGQDGSSSGTNASDNGLQGENDKERSDADATSDEDDIPGFCNPTDPMGAWLNFEKVREWCIEHGFTDLSPYGGASQEETTTVAALSADSRDETDQGDN